MPPMHLPSQTPPLLALFLDVLPLVFLLPAVPLLLWELISLYRRDELTGTRIRGILTSAFCFLPATITEALLGAALVSLFFLVSAFIPWSLPTTWPTALACLLLVDFLYYWEHRLGHEVNLLWALYHSVHHSAGHYDQSIGLRISFVDFFFSPLFFLPLVLLGFHPLLVFACLGVVLAWQQWLHTEEIDRLPLLDPWLNTPSNHRVHHGSNHEYLDRNYGGILMVWDRLFGTWIPEGEKVIYGLVDPLESQNPVEVHAHVLSKLIHAFRSTRGWRARMKLLFSNPPF